jgi:acetyltransferase-like isoleucine patch superfamily enzyme
MNIDVLNKIKKVFLFERKKIQDKYNRVLSIGDYISDRREKAKYLGFGEGTTVYDNVLILGSVEVGENTWIGPNVVLDGSGGLIIGSNCSISAGVQIYSHDSINWAISGGKEKKIYDNTVIGNNCYIGPNVIIQKGITIGDNCIIGTNSFVNKNIPKNQKAFGTPIRIKEEVIR